MNWSTLMLLSAGLAASQGATQSMQFESYTKAYHTASESHKPMFVVLNPPAGEVAVKETVSIDSLRADPKIGPLLDGYVVAIVDTGTEHGQLVHKAFGEKPLPYMAVIDEQQDKQVFTTSEQLSNDKLQTVLAKYKDGAKAASLADQIRLENDCPLCRRNQTSF